MNQLKWKYILQLHVMYHSLFLQILDEAALEIKTDDIDTGKGN